MEDEIVIREPKKKPKKDIKESKEPKKSNRNKMGIYVGIILIILGIIWYAIDAGLIPARYLEAWPQFIIIILGLLIVIKSL